MVGGGFGGGGVCGGVGGGVVGGGVSGLCVCVCSACRVRRVSVSGICVCVCSFPSSPFLVLPCAHQASSSESLVTTESSEPAHSVNGFLMRLAEERVQREDFEQATAKCLEEWFSKLSMDVDAKIAQLAKGLEDQARDGAVVRQRLDEVLPTLADVWHRLCTETPAKVREPASRAVEARVEERTSTASRRVSDHGPKGARSAHGHADASSGYSVRAKGSRQEVVVATRPSVTAPSPGSSLVTTAGDSSVGVSRRHVDPHVHPHSAAFLSSSTHRRRLCWLLDVTWSTHSQQTVNWAKPHTTPHCQRPGRTPLQADRRMRRERNQGNVQNTLMVVVVCVEWSGVVFHACLD